MKKYVCKLCGYVELKESPPEKCPQCGAPRSQFEEREDALKKAADEENLTELEKKHIAVIKQGGSCSLVEGCLDVNVEIGSIIHPMEPDKHWIMFADVYLEKEFISRIKFNPVRLYPAFKLHLKEAEGEFGVVTHCNLHGNYISAKKVG